ncbi:MAG: hypothetical protein ACI9EW_000535 [Cellvibrionaceae bacterium]|jgi:hypothetical protein
MKKHLFICLLPFVFACQLSGVFDPTSIPTSAATLQATITSQPIPAKVPAKEPVPAGALAGGATPLPVTRYEPFGTADLAPVLIPAVVPLYKPNLALVADLERFELTTTERERLGNDGFLVRPDHKGTAADVYANGVPHMLTVDMVLLHTFAIQQEVLNNAARTFSQRQSYDLITGLISESKNQLAITNDPLTVQAARKNLAIFNMAGKFYDENWPIEPEVAAEMSLELPLFESEGEFESPLLGRRVRYDTIRQDPLSAARVYVWFLLSSLTIDPQASPAEQRLTGKQIELLLDIWSADTVPAWREQHARHRYQNGTEGPHIEEWLALYKTGARRDDFIQSVAQFENARFTLFGFQQSTHAQIFEQLIFNRVGVHETPENAPATARREVAGVVRGTPRLIDIAAAFGSSLALDQLMADGEAGYAGWEQQMIGLQAQFAEPGRWPATWQQDALVAIQLLAQPAPANYPAYMHAAEWSPLAQWEMGFLLSSMPYMSNPTQAGRVSTDQNRNQNQFVYIEPRPDLYANLAAQTRILADGLVAKNMLDELNATRLVALESDLLMLKSIAEKQLAGIPPRPNSAESAVLATVLAQASGVQVPDFWPVYSSSLGSLTGQFEGFIPTLFVVLDGNKQMVAQGGRIRPFMITGQ